MFIVEAITHFLGGKNNKIITTFITCTQILSWNIKIITIIHKTFPKMDIFLVSVIRQIKNKIHSCGLKNIRKKYIQNELQVHHTIILMSVTTALWVVSPYLSGRYWHCLLLGSGRTGCVWHRPTCHCHFGPSWWGTDPCDCSACLCRQSAHWRRCGAACPPAYIPWTHGSPVQEKILHDYYMHYCLIKEVVIYIAIIHLW